MRKEPLFILLTLLLIFSCGKVKIDEPEIQLGAEDRSLKVKDVSQSLEGTNTVDPAFFDFDVDGDGFNDLKFSALDKIDASAGVESKYVSVSTLQDGDSKTELFLALSENALYSWVDSTSGDSMAFTNPSPTVLIPGNVSPILSSLDLPRPFMEGDTISESVLHGDFGGVLASYFKQDGQNSLTERRTGASRDLGEHYLGVLITVGSRKTLGYVKIMIEDYSDLTIMERGYKEID